MKPYLHFTAQDFILDNYFQAWVLHPDEQTNTFWNGWLAKHPEKQAEVNEAREILSHFTLPSYKLSSEEVGGLWQKIKEGQNKLKKTESVSNKKTIWYWSAACFILITVSFLIFFQSYQVNVEYTTGFGETKKIHLPDSSTVILNANSRITFVKNWEENPAREVWIEGEAFFDIVHKHDDQPFIVKTKNNLAVEVLGTTFNVYQRSVDTKVVLNTGQIALSFPVKNKAKKILMKPGDFVEFKQNQYSKKVVDPKAYAAWTEKKLILNETSLREIIQMARDNYGIEITVKSTDMLNQTVSGSMPLDNAENFVNQVAKIFQLKVNQNQGEILFDAENNLIEPKQNN